MKLLAFKQRPHSTLNLWLVNADGTGVTPLTTATALGASSSVPGYSP